MIQNKDLLKREALRAEIRAGINALDRGEFNEIPACEIERYLAGLTVAKGSKRDKKLTAG